MSRLPIDPDLLEDASDRRPEQRSSLRGQTPSDHGAAVLTTVAVGGGVGSLLRYAVAEWLVDRPGGFPWATYLVNIGGCLLIGVLMVAVTETWPRTRLVRPLLGIGFLGGLTTYSTMMLDLRDLGALDDWLVAVCYLLTSIVGGLLAVWVGIAAARKILPSPRALADVDRGR